MRIQRIIGFILLLLGILLIPLGGIFKIESWPLASELLILGLLGIFIGLILIFLFGKKNEIKN